MASRGLMRRHIGCCLGGTRNTTISSRTPAGARLRSTSTGKELRSCSLIEHKTARSRPSTSEGGVSCCAKTSLRCFTQTPHRRTSEGADPPKQRPSRAKRSGVGVLVSLAAGLLYTLIPDDAFSRPGSAPALNDQTFRKFTVVSNEPISPTSFILTVRPSRPPGGERASAEVICRAWEHGLWSVEFKQPQLQIARNYTPLPPRDGDDAATLRFLVRRYDGGEVSKYLSRLRGGGSDVVELRGPHLGFDVAARLGAAGRDVVFLAGGTGIAPALQLARRVLAVPEAEQGGLSVRILWANRSAEECAGCPRLEGQRGQRGRSWAFWSSAGGGGGPGGDEEVGAPGPIVEQLRELEAAYGRKGNTLESQCVVDGEGRRIGAGDITTAVSRSMLSPPINDNVQLATSTQASTSFSCHLHSQRLLQNSTEEADTQKEKNEQVSGMRGCTCSGDGSTGRNLFMISGPDGFVGAYVGSKVWAAGAERQGPLGGIVGELRKKDPKAWADWLVLKQ